MSASRSRQKRKLEPISIEELAGTTGMSGFCSFLTRDSSVPVPVLDQIETGAPDSTAAETTARKTTAPDIAAPNSTAPEMAAPVATANVDEARVVTAPHSRYGQITSAPEMIAVETRAPVAGESDSTAGEWSALEPSEFRYRRRPRIRQAITVQDGHSLAEQAVYDAMYREGKPYKGHARILTIGLRTLAELSRMAYSNCKANVRSLVAKLALEELPGFSYTDGRTYIIHAGDEILRRRHEAGLTHVLRTRGVAFVEPQSGAPISSAPDTR